MSGIRNGDCYSLSGLPRRMGNTGGIPTDNCEPRIAVYIRTCPIFSAISDIRSYVYPILTIPWRGISAT
jgi:hypothetical protein